MIGRIHAHEDFIFIATANPAELAGVHRLSEALRDRLRVWVPLTYPDREVELKIIRMNCEPASLNADILNEVYSIIRATREVSDPGVFASIRAGISIAKLVANHISQYGELESEVLVRYAISVLLGTSKGKGWMEERGRIEQLVKDALAHV
jgi:MoxR-like ATPase